MLKKKYKAFVIRDQTVTSAVVAGTLTAIGEFIKGCGAGNILTIHTMEGEPFLIGLSSAFLYCEDNEFLDQELIPYLREK